MLSLFLCSLQQIVSKLGGGLAGFRAECRDKIDLAPKSCAERDLADRKAGRVQQRFRLVDTVEHDILMRRKAGRGAENTRKMRCTEVDVRGDAADRELLGQMAVDEAHRLRDCIVFCGTVRALRQEQAAQDAVQGLRALDLAGFAGLQAKDELRKLLLEMQRGGRREHLSAAMKGDDLLKKCARVRPVEVQPKRFCVTVREKAVRSAAVHEGSLSALENS